MNSKNQLSTELISNIIDSQFLAYYGINKHYKEPKGILIHPKSLKVLFMSFQGMNNIGLPKSMKNMKYRGVPMYRSKDIEQHEIIVY